MPKYLFIIPRFLLNHLLTDLPLEHVQVDVISHLLVLSFFKNITFHFRDLKLKGDVFVFNFI